MGEKRGTSYRQEPADDLGMKGSDSSPSGIAVDP